MLDTYDYSEKDLSQQSAKNWTQIEINKKKMLGLMIIA